MGRREIELQTEELLQPIIDEFGFELVDVEYVKEGSNWYLRAYIDKENGIDIDDCVNVSRRLEEKLDEKDFIEEAYVLEVSSPGLTRPLKKEKDFLRSIGRRIEVKLYKELDGIKEFECLLQGYENNEITVLVDGEDEPRSINLKDAAMVRLAFE